MIFQHLKIQNSVVLVNHNTCHVQFHITSILCTLMIQQKKWHFKRDTTKTTTLSSCTEAAMMRVLKPRLMGVAAISMGSLEAWYVSYWLIDLLSQCYRNKNKDGTWCETQNTTKLLWKEHSSLNWYVWCSVPCWFPRKGFRSEIHEFHCNYVGKDGLFSLLLRFYYKVLWVLTKNGNVPPRHEVFFLGPLNLPWVSLTHSLYI